MPRALLRPYGGLPASFVKTCQHSRVSVEGVGGWGWEVGIQIRHVYTIFWCARNKTTAERILGDR